MYNVMCCEKAFLLKAEKIVRLSKAVSLGAKDEFGREKHLCACRLCVWVAIGACTGLSVRMCKGV